VNTHQKIAIILASLVTAGLFIMTFVQFPTNNIFRILGQLLASASLGLIVYFIAYAIGSFISKITK